MNKIDKDRIVAELKGTMFLEFEQEILSKCHIAKYNKKKVKIHHIGCECGLNKKVIDKVDEEFIKRGYDKFSIEDLKKETKKICKKINNTRNVHPAYSLSVFHNTMEEIKNLTK